MFRANGLCGALCLLAAGLTVGCRQPAEPTTPPDARRPQLKTEGELAAARAARIEAGEVVPTSLPATPPVDRTPRSARTPPLLPTPGAIQADILVVNDTILTVPEVLFPLRQTLEELRRTRTAAGFREEARRAIRRATQEELGTRLIYAEAVAQLSEEHRKALDAALDKELENYRVMECAGSQARMDALLRRHDLTKDQLRTMLGRSMVVRQYTREKLMPQVQVSRHDLLSYYRRNHGRYVTPETRELLIIEVPFEKCLPEGVNWARASSAARSQAKLKAMRRAREAHEALAARPFEDVAREYSLGLHADTGGSWGFIGRPLQPPYDAVSQKVFEFTAGQVSEPIETEAGWYVVKCGEVRPAAEKTFAEVQDQIRAELTERRFAKLSTDYVLRLAEKATISSFEPFIAAAVRRAEQVFEPTAPTAGTP
ncbi:MAG: peptidylprolyl isomerase [Planctomycetota bacterium]